MSIACTGKRADLSLWRHAGDHTMLPSASGTYILVLRSAATGRIRIGRLGTLQLRPGYYVYIGSAFGPGGLRGRISHHERVAKHPRWHVDYLRRHTWLESVFYRCGERREHAWAGAIGATSGANAVLLGFGSSDCGCAAHLYWFQDRSRLEILQRALRAEVYASVPDRLGCDQS
jgi:Uri superfamily endonuclease